MGFSGVLTRVLPLLGGSWILTSRGISRRTMLLISKYPCASTMVDQHIEAGFILLLCVSVCKVPFSFGECIYLVSFWGYKK